MKERSNDSRDFEERKRVEKEMRARAKQVLEEIASGLGYESVPSFEALGLTDEEIRKLHYFNPRFMSPDAGFYRKQRQDGVIVKAIAQPTMSNFSADIFSPAFYNGHGCNHDFNKEELKGILALALSGEPYPQSKS